jgi:hypothetical protein
MKGQGSCEITRAHLVRRQIGIHGDDLAEMEQLAHFFTEQYFSLSAVGCSHISGPAVSFIVFPEGSGRYRSDNCAISGFNRHPVRFASLISPASPDLSFRTFSA